MKHTQCPSCQSKNTTLAPAQFPSAPNQAFKNRICLNCGTAWRPRCPRWLAVAVIILGTAIPPIQFAIDKGFSDVNSAVGQSRQGGGSHWISFAFAGAAIAGGLMALFGDVGKMKILGKIEPKKTTPNNPPQPK
jgi:hypothetical protein